jgi:hypothetical protein
MPQPRQPGRETAIAEGDDLNGKVIDEFRANGGKVGVRLVRRAAARPAEHEKTATPREIPVIVLDPVA